MTKGCYTCRRRRITCDNGLPTCRKCRDAGKECLGYRKPLVWVKGGVASRGKMMGRSFDDVSEEHTEKRNDDGDPGAAPEPAGSLSAFDARQNNSDYLPAPRGMVDPLFKDLTPLSRFYIVHFNQNLVSYLALYSNVKNPFRDMTPLVAESPVLAHALAAIGALHYTILANDDISLMPWSSDGSETMGPLMSPEEVEMAAISSMARRPSSKVYEHFLGLKQRTLQQLSVDICDPVMRNDTRTLATIMVLALMDAIESGDGAWKSHLEGAKKLLQSRENDSGPSKDRGIIDWLDTFAIDGCLLIQLMGSTLARPGSLSKPFYSTNMGASVLKRLEETSWVGCPAYLLEVIFIVHSGWCSEPEPNSSTTPRMIFSSAFLSENSNPLEFPRAFLQHIQAFDPTAWAEAMQNCLYLPDLTMRIALATVYQASVYLYASRVLSRPRAGTSTTPPSPLHDISLGLPADHSDVANLLIRQIALIPVADPHFKCLIWPTFIAGAECRDPAQRPFIMEKLSTLYYDITSINVRNAAWVLSLMWRKRDLKRQEKLSRRWQVSTPTPTSTPASVSTSSSSPSAFASASANNSPYAAGSAYNSSSPPYATPYDNDNDDDDDFDWIQELDESRIDWLFI